MGAERFAGKMTSTLDQDNTSFVGRGLIGKIGGFLNRIFGCWHSEMSRPFSSEGQSYRVCLSCGARREFNLRNWETRGDYYFRLPRIEHYCMLNGMSTLRRSRSVS